MQVRINKDGGITIEFQQHKDLYYASTWQAGQLPNSRYATIILSLSPETAKELLEKLKEVL